MLEGREPSPVSGDIARHEQCANRGDHRGEESPRSSAASVASPPRAPACVTLGVGLLGESRHAVLWCTQAPASGRRARRMSADVGDLAMTVPSNSDRRLPREELVFQMSSERHRRLAIAAIDDVDGDSVFAFPVERYSTGESLLLVIMVDDEYLALAITAVLSIDPHAQQPMAS